MSNTIKFTDIVKVFLSAIIKEVEKNKDKSNLTEVYFICPYCNNEGAWTTQRQVDSDAKYYTTEDESKRKKYEKKKELWYCECGNYFFAHYQLTGLTKLAEKK